MSTKAEHPTADQALRQLKTVENLWLKGRITDSTLHPIVWLVFSGLFILAWLIQPGNVDSAISVSLLMFLRFVLGFIVVGSIWGRVGAGMLVGVCLFFMLMCMNSLSILMWDAPLSRIISNPIQHAEWLANALFVLGLCGLIVCALITFVLRSGRFELSRRFVRLSLQALSMFQIMLLVELGYTGLSYATKLDQRGMPTTRASDWSDSPRHTPSASSLRDDRSFAPKTPEKDPASGRSSSTVLPLTRSS